MSWLWNALPYAFVFSLLCAAAYVLSRYRDAERIGRKVQEPLSGDDRLRISLVVRSIEEAERELLKAAWKGNQPGHPSVGELLLDLKEFEARARRLLREH